MGRGVRLYGEWSQVESGGVMVFWIEWLCRGSVEYISIKT